MPLPPVMTCLHALPRARLHGRFGSGPLAGVLAAAALALAACAPGAGPAMTRAESPATEIPAPGTGLAPHAAADAAQGGTLTSNRQLAADFMELTFFLETGRPLPRLTRFEGPVGIVLTGAVPPGAPAELSRLIARLRAEAGLDIAVTASAENRITVDFLPKARMQALVPNAACFVVPGVTGWADYTRHRGSPRTDWTALKVRRAASVFIPADAPPQEIRDCLHEEIGQALGPLNDLFRLPGSVFNDDNFTGVLGAFDMTILRITHAPELASGMDADAVAARLPAILARINPRGGKVGAVRAAAGPGTPPEFSLAIAQAMGNSPRAATGARLAAARRAVALAQAQGWADGRAGFAHFAHGRLLAERDPAAAVAAFVTAGRIYAALPGGQAALAHVDLQLAALALRGGDAGAALVLADRALPGATAAQNAALMASLHLIRAAAHDRLGAPEAARQARLDSASLARYGFGAGTGPRGPARPG